MHFFLYEWIVGGGLVEETGKLPKSLLTEGSAMLTALAKDLAALPDSSVSVLKDMRLDDLSLPPAEVREVQSRYEHDEEFRKLAGMADYTIVIAPEFDGHLLRCLDMVADSGGNLLGSNSKFVKVTADKHRAARRLEKAGVPVPEAILLEPEVVKLPEQFSYPAVLKPVDGAGSQHTMLLSKATDEPPASAWPQRLERFCPGVAASVSFLCGPQERLALPPCRQNLSSDGKFAYLGGERLMEQELARRATALAGRALDALPPACGYVGVDIVLGHAADGSEDFVIEVNPRLTTSYVGLRAMTSSNLASIMLDISGGENVSDIQWNDENVEFFADGTVCYQDRR